LRRKGEVSAGFSLYKVADDIFFKLFLLSLHLLTNFAARHSEDEHGNQANALTVS
jgi:hypothetical protein